MSSIKETLDELKRHLDDAWTNADYAMDRARDASTSAREAMDTASSAEDEADSAFACAEEARSDAECAQEEFEKLCKILEEHNVGDLEVESDDLKPLIKKWRAKVIEATQRKPAPPPAEIARQFGISEVVVNCILAS